MAGPATPSHDGDLSLNAAAARLGVHYMTAYRYVRTGRMPATKRGGQWYVTEGDLAAVIEVGTGPRRRAVAAVDGQPLWPMLEPFTDRLVAGDGPGCWNVISDMLASGAGATEVLERLITPALVRVGERWECGEITVGDEHRSTATVHRLLGQLAPLFRHPGRRRGTVVIGVVAGDPHALPSAIMSDLLTDLRFTVIDLGANTPTASFTDCATRADDLVAVGVCIPTNAAVPTAIVQLRDIRATCGDVSLVAGGPRLTDDERGRLVPLVDATTSTGAEACAAFVAAAQRRRERS